MKKQSVLKKLYPKLIDGTINEEELIWLKTYFHTGDPDEMYHLIRSELSLSNEKEEPTPQESQVLARIYDRISTAEFNKTETVYLERSTRKLWFRLAIAVTLAGIVFGAGLFFFKYKSNTGNIDKYVNGVSSGKKGATLTLANGQKILINDVLTGNIASQSGVKISKEANGQILYEITNDKSGILEYNTLSTTRGEQAQVRLPDGTVAFLNAESSIKYPTSFSRLHKREVFLIGEAYFEVKKDKIHPFMVRSAKQQIEVLGTHFNVNTYEDEGNNKTTLLEGAVKIMANGQSRVLKPGQQAVNNGVDLTINNVDVNEALSWKDGYFDFTDADIHTVMRQFARWYDVEVEFVGVTTKETFTGRVPRKWNLNQVLKIVRSSNSLNITVEGRRIMVRE